MGLQKSWQTQKVLKRIWRKSNYEAMLKNIFCNTSIEFLKATFWRWNLIFATEKNSRFAFVNTFCSREFSFKKPCPFEKSDLNKRCILASSNWLWIWFHFEMEPKPFNLRPRKQLHSSTYKWKGYIWKQKIYVVLEILSWHGKIFCTILARFGFCWLQPKFWSQHFEQMQLLVQRNLGTVHIWVTLAGIIEVG